MNDTRDGMPVIRVRKVIEVYPHAHIRPEDLFSRARPEDRFFEGDLVEINNYNHLGLRRLSTTDTYNVNGETVKHYIGRIKDILDDSLLLDISREFYSHTIIIPFDEIGNIQIYKGEKL